MKEVHETLSTIEATSIIDKWKREYNETAERIEAGYANEDAYQTLKQEINEFFDEQLKWRRILMKVITILTVMTLLAFVAFLVVGLFFKDYRVEDWVLVCVHALPVLFAALLVYARVLKMKCEKRIYDAMTFDARYFNGDIRRLRNLTL